MNLVIGGAGFIGSAVVRRLVSRGEKVVVATTRPPRALALLDGLGVEIRQADVRDDASLATAMAGCKRVVISIQFPGFPVEDPRRGRTFQEIDLGGTRRVVAVAERLGVERLVYVSGVNVSPTAPQHWFRTKWASESALRGGTIPWSIIRPTWVYGPGDKTVSLLVKAARLAPFILLPGDGQQRQQPTYSGQVAEAIVAGLLRDEAVGQIVEVGGADVLTFDALIKIIQDVVGRHVPIGHVPIQPLKALAALAAATPWRPTTPDAIEFVTMNALSNNTVLTDLLGIVPLSFREGLASYLS